MTQEDKFLLLKDLCARLPYNPIIYIHDILVDDYDNYLCEDYLAKIRVHQITAKPYLRPMSSMTEEEVKYKLSTFFKVINTKIEGVGYIPTLNSISAIGYIDWLIANHFDYRGLIPMGLALEAKEGMYN